jgi:hypothetical protein
VTPHWDTAGVSVLPAQHGRERGDCRPDQCGRSRTERKDDSSASGSLDIVSGAFDGALHPALRFSGRQSGKLGYPTDQVSAIIVADAVMARRCEKDPSRFSARILQIRTCRRPRAPEKPVEVESNEVLAGHGARWLR